MNPITLSGFRTITSTYGKAAGQAYFDAEESITHDMYPDRIVFYTNFLDHRTYEAYVVEEELQVKKTRLDNYHLHLKATVIEDSMDEEDWEELDQLWGRMAKDLISAPKVDVHSALQDLFFYLFPETDILVPEKKNPDLQWIWEQVSSALEATNRSASFEWKEWIEIGVMEVNNLAPVKELNIEIPYPDKKQIKEVTHAADWERAILQYFNAHLDAHDLKLLAVGTHFDEYQTFACLSMGDLSLVNALEISGRLGIVYKY